MKLPWSLLPLAVAGTVVLTACGGDDDATSERADSSSSTVPGDAGDDEPTDPDTGGGDQRDDIPDVDVCSLAADTLRAQFLQVMGQEPTVQPSTDQSGRPQCEWSGAGSSLDLTVTVSSYDDAGFEEVVLEQCECTPVPGLGDEAYMSESLGRAGVRWRRDGFSVHLRDFPVEDVVTIAHEIDGQMPPP